MILWKKNQNHKYIYMYKNYNDYRPWFKCC